MTVVLGLQFWTLWLNNHVSELVTLKDNVQLSVLHVWELFSQYFHVNALSIQSLSGETCSQPVLIVSKNLLLVLPSWTVLYELWQSFNTLEVLLDLHCWCEWGMPGIQATEDLKCASWYIPLYMSNMASQTLVGIQSSQILYSLSSQITSVSTILC